ncbi:MAG: DNA (cytosine-5-)-methyltransferase [Sphingomonadales bacterium]|nr:MAG: DNA (cytosine-5-)-methyltransferase [Sphingomonadales bacterium]
MRYGSVCSGIEAATQAWHPLGWKPSFFSEIDPFPRAVLQHHYADVPLHGDFTTIKRGDYEPIDLLVGGTPCQSFSIAGLRGGLGDDRGNLALEYLRLADRLRPKWLVWENVPGVLSSREGRDFGSILGGMVELGYGVAYRVLDAQYVRTLPLPWAVPQRRRRVFVVGYLGDWRRAAAVLFERESLSGNPAPRRETGKGASEDVAPSLVSSGRGVERIGETLGQDPVVAVANSGDVGYCLTASAQNSLDAETETLIASATGDVSHALRAEGFDASEDGTGRGTSIVAFDCKGSQVQFTEDGSHPTLRSMAHNASHHNAGGHAAVAVPYSIMPMNSGKDYKARETEVAQPLMAGGPVGGNQGGDFVAQNWAVRRLTPVECERLQGFPDSFTDVPWRGKDHAPDGRRYKALGNSMAVNVMRYIGDRIQLVENITNQES